jgi:hypothetical protein
MFDDGAGAAGRVSDGDEAKNQDDRRQTDEAWWRGPWPIRAAGVRS